MTQNPPANGLRIAISAGEVSGDQHLSHVVAALKISAPETTIRGMAGKRCADAGAELVVDCFRHGATMGFSELLKPLRSLFHSFFAMRKLLMEWKPHLLILVDYPDFNLRLARYAKKLGIKVLYFVPPKVWAWRSGRVETMKQCIDHIAAIFPFEKDFYAARGIAAVSYVGNPLSGKCALQAQQPSSSSRIVIMLAGSRVAEVERILVPMLRVFERLLKGDPELSGVVVSAPNMDPSRLREQSNGAVSSQAASRITWVSRDAMEVMAEGFVGMLKSGTCNLEAAMAGLPFVSVYSGSRVAQFFVRRLVTLKEYSPVNIIRSGTVRELMQVSLNEDTLFSYVSEISRAGKERDSIIAGLSEVRERLSGSESRPLFDGTHTVAERVSRLAMHLCEREVHV
jgi:lipid-A-disaccharide synthase